MSAWKELKRGMIVRVVDLEDDHYDQEGVVSRVEPCTAPDSAWVYVRFNDSHRIGLDSMFLLIDSHPSRLQIVCA